MKHPSPLDRLRHHAAEQWPHAIVALALWCAMLPLALSGRAATSAPPPSGEWPVEWRGQPLQPLGLSPVEQRFASQFPGRIARFALADGGELVLRDVRRPTRMLHPAADCWRSIGWSIRSTRLARDEQQSDTLWRCFEAERHGQHVRVCERIVDAQGRGFTDTSAWFWAASLGQSSGPWQAITHVQGLGS